MDLVKRLQEAKIEKKDEQKAYVVELEAVISGRIIVDAKDEKELYGFN